jgi:hypothetical protein
MMNCYIQLKILCQIINLVSISNIKIGIIKIINVKIIYKVQNIQESINQAKILLKLLKN